MSMKNLEKEGFREMLPWAASPSGERGTLFVSGENK
jgi:hypothetical protein